MAEDHIYSSYTLHILNIENGNKWLDFKLGHINLIKPLTWLNKVENLYTWNGIYYIVFLQQKSERSVGYPGLARETNCHLYVKQHKI